LGEGKRMVGWGEAERGSGGWKMGGEGGVVGSDHGTNQPVTPGGGLSFQLFCSCLSIIELNTFFFKTPDRYCDKT
jgi:hypothetical protein